MVYYIVAGFDVPADRRTQFIDAAAEAGRDSCAFEPGTLVFKVVADEQIANRFYLIEEYLDPEAFAAHSAGPHFKRFFDTLAEWGQSGPDILVRGSDVPSPPGPPR